MDGGVGWQSDEMFVLLECGCEGDEPAGAHMASAHRPHTLLPWPCTPSPDIASGSASQRGSNGPAANGQNGLGTHAAMTRPGHDPALAMTSPPALPPPSLLLGYPEEAEEAAGLIVIVIAVGGG